MKKTNAARLLDSKSINYELVEYEVDESDLSATTLAKKIGEDIEQIFKTLVLRGDKTSVFVCIIPGNSEVDLKKAAKISGNKNCAMVHQKELLPLTGYIRGGCSPLGMKKPYATYIHETCQLFDSIFVSAGQRGLQFRINPENLIKVTGSVVCNLVELYNIGTPTTLLSTNKSVSTTLLSRNKCIHTTLLSTYAILHLK
jgi:Cys-tRNA(Pro)/Cys-tRNA(Cys) deacylase